ncbi:MAG: hypothetical protein EKK42_20285 [Pseudonocardiaceae bacterium]|nr:MAG: hypothetical protein EKK42_20285 [Pseudonocardiaceae bacterium]
MTGSAVARPLHAVIAELAITPDIPKLLRDAGIRGTTGDQCSCAIAEYVRLRTGKPWVQVDWFNTVTGSEGTHLLDSENNPPNVQDFIEDFDAGLFPELERSR